MICKFFKNKKGEGGGIPSIDYLLNKERVENSTARVLKGDEATTRAIISSLNFKQKACVGVLSFAENDIPEAQKFEIMQEFERALLTDEMQGRYNILWVEHRDKGRLELNFVIPKVDLQTQKSFNPYYFKSDFKRIDYSIDYLNAKYNFIDPKDPLREQGLKDINHYAPTFNDHKALKEHLENEVLQGRLKNRAELIEYIKTDLKDFNIEITRQGKDYISLKLPNEQKATRYKGEIYADTTDYARAIRENYERKQRESGEFSKRTFSENIIKLRERAERAVEIKAKQYREHHEKQVKRDIDRNIKYGINTQKDLYSTDSINYNITSSNNLSNLATEFSTERMAELQGQQWRESDTNTAEISRNTHKQSQRDLSNNNQAEQGLKSNEYLQEIIRKFDNRERELTQQNNSNNARARQREREQEQRNREFAEQVQARNREFAEQVQARNREFDTKFKAEFYQLQVATREQERKEREQRRAELINNFRELGKRVETKDTEISDIRERFADFTKRLQELTRTMRDTITRNRELTRAEQDTTKRLYKLKSKIERTISRATIIKKRISKWLSNSIQATSAKVERDFGKELKKLKELVRERKRERHLQR